MKRKQRDAIIAMGLKMSGLEGLSRDQHVKINDAKQEIANILRTLKLHGEAHMAQDLLPQFTELAKKVEKLEGDIMPGVISGKTSLWSRVSDIERNKADAISLSGQAGEQIRTRLADHDESIEALSETVDQLSTCKCEAGNQMLKRIAELERAVYNSPFSKIVMEQYAERIGNLEESDATFLKSIPDIEILKTQVQGLEDDRKALFPHTHTPTDDKINFVANQVKVLVRPVETLKIQMHNLLPVHNNMVTEVLKQKKFLEKVQAILDRERDARIEKSPGYKKEIAAQKQEAMVMDKHLDTMVKKGRPRKP